MLAASPDRLAAALAEVDPVDRALLALSFRRGVDDYEIARLLGTDRAGVERRREAVIDAVASVLGLYGPEELAELRVGLAKLPPDAWTAPLGGEAGGMENGGEVVDRVGYGPAPVESAPPASMQETQPTAAPAPLAGETVAEPWRPGTEAWQVRDASTTASQPTVLFPKPPPPPARPRRGRRRVLLAALPLLIAGIVAGILIATDDDGSDSSPTPTLGAPAGPPLEPRPRPPARPAPAPASRRPPAPRSRRAGFRALPGAKGAGGTARLVGTGRGARLELSISGLPDPGEATYEIWLYDSIAKAVSLGRFDTTEVKIDARAPDDPADYRYLDVSREPADGNRNHSGESVLRLPLARLRATD